ncbi:GntR family transcriptional regulator [Planomonospora sp. ID82291]|uniref:GntR family transcriptional regulator n=1 Tax=Planomonospora sp. ID82291 TaxID=2738136 RepID=UPI0018C44846|nr:GntR family transcriptional regulator [Planomonospora sp. ID82291]MBG0814993.1 GntR family transcriptional regulator [Planomonospora sp. ID82291]
MPEPLYRQLAERLRARIDAGDLRPGDQIPSEAELGEEFGVSRNTVRLAVTALANEGLIESRAGRGTFVRQRRTVTVLHPLDPSGVPPGPKDAFKSTLEREGVKPTQENFRVEFRRATAEVAARLGIEEGDRVVVRRMDRLVDGEPWSRQESFYPVEIAEGTELMSPDDIPRGTIRVLKENGHAQVGFRDEINCRMPTRDESGFLGSPPGVPVLELFRVAYSEERPIRLTITVYAGDSTQFAYEVGDVSARGETGRGSRDREDG